MVRDRPRQRGGFSSSEGREFRTVGDGGAGRSVRRFGGKYTRDSPPQGEGQKWRGTVPCMARVSPPQGEGHAGIRTFHRQLADGKRQLQIVNRPLQIVNRPLRIVNRPLQIVNRPLQIVNRPLLISSGSREFSLSRWRTESVRGGLSAARGRKQGTKTRKEQLTWLTSSYRRTS